MTTPAETFIGRLGICRIETLNEYSADNTNCYFIDGDTPALIDTGLATQEAYDSIRLALSRVGRNISDIGRIILTHGHADHRALAPRIRAESGAEVFCHRLEAARAADVPPGQKSARRQRENDFFRSMGVPEELLAGLVDGPQSPPIKPRLDRVLFLDDGEELDFERFKLRVLHTPGHSGGSICLHDGENGLLFTGDTLLPSSRVTPLIEVEMLESDPAYSPLKLHMESLRKLLRLDAAYLLPGHGEIFVDYRKTVEVMFERHRKRQNHVLRALRNGRRTLYQICRSVFLFSSSDDLYLALSELLGNTELLVERKEIIRLHENGLVYYQRV